MTVFRRPLSVPFVRTVPLRMTRATVLAAVASFSVSLAQEPTENESAPLPQESSANESAPRPQEQTEGESLPEAATYAPFRLNFVELPYNGKHGVGTLSMDQTLAITQTTYSALHWGIAQVLPVNGQGWKGFFSRLAVGVTDLALYSLPLSGAWLHEEWHRAVMSHRGVSSKNDINSFNVGGKVIAVSHETDEALAKMKQEHPKDFLRLSTAGMESSNALVLSMQKNTFFRGATTFDLVAQWLTITNPITYLHGCASKDSDQTTKEQEEKEGSSIPKRDFTGLDCNAWAYDLFRPNEPYAARGTHPSGVGIRRYRSYKDHSSEERAFLKKQASLSFLSLVNPMLFGFNEFSFESPTTGRPLAWNAALGYDLTPFGHALSFRTLFKSVSKVTPHGVQGMMLRYYQYFNKNNSFPGLEIDHQPVPMGESQVSVGAKFMLWQQPKNLDFAQSAKSVGGLGALRVYSSHFENISPYAEVVSKSNGWVVGEVSLEKSTSVRIGLESALR